jgi:hypothetical protein
MAARSDAVSKEEQFHFDHVALNTQGIKLINVMNIDPFVKKVVTLRLMYPILTGKERTHLSIALELGALERDVIQADAYGMQQLERQFTHNGLHDLLRKFDSESSLEKSIKNQGNSIQNDRIPKEGA